MTDKETDRQTAHGQSIYCTTVALHSKNRSFKNKIKMNT